MLSSVLHSQQAIRVNIEIMRAFVRMRRPLVTRGDLDALEKAICFLLDHPKKAKDMGNQVKILVKKNRDSKILNIKKVDVKSDAWGLLKNLKNKLFKAEGNIDWQLSATDIALIIRGLSPRPVAFSHYNENAIRIWSAEVVQSNPESENSKAGVITKVGKQGIEVNCANNTKLLITSLQIPGGKQLSVQQLLNAKPDLFSVGSSFYSELEK